MLLCRFLKNMSSGLLRSSCGYLYVLGFSYGEKVPEPNSSPALGSGLKTCENLLYYRVFFLLNTTKIKELAKECKHRLKILNKHENRICTVCSKLLWLFLYKGLFGSELNVLKSVRWSVLWSRSILALLRLQLVKMAASAPALALALYSTIFYWKKC